MSANTKLLTESETQRSIPSPATAAKSSYSSAYPPNALPGSRDVSTPYGKMRVYEWGPPEGRKVMFVHGDATPCPIFYKIAQGLVSKGCRVLLFDLWGRGHSDSPLGVSHDSRLFSMQMLFAIMSSSVAWTGPTKLSIVGFSLGAAISLDFITTYPWLIEAVVFLGPAGLLKKLPYDYERIVEMPSPLARSDARMRTMVEAILGVDTTMPMHRALASNGEDAIKQENVDQESLAEHSNSKDFDMGALLQWQYEFHEGHVYSFYNTVRNGPLMDCAPLWSKFGDLITGKAKSQPPCELSTAKVLVVFGDSDDVVVGPEVSEEILKKMPEGNVMFKYVAGGHGFVYPNSDQILEEIAFLWGL